jgi:N-acetyl-anhydromuramyl-L-alanine amidase AmpD
MAQSQEYPDLAFVQPKAWGSGRDGKAVRYIVVHYTAGSEGPTSAEDGAAYDQRRTDGTSTHYFVDSNSVVQCVYTWDRANAALHKANRLGIQYELCGTAQTAAQWADAVSDATIWNAARQMARDVVKYGLQIRRLTTSEVRGDWYNYPNGPKGICGHVDVTNAYPEDGGDHTDPGTAFPWQRLLDRIQYFVNGGTDPMADFTDLQVAQINNAERYGAAVIQDLDAAQGISNTVTSVNVTNVNKQKRVAIEGRLTALEQKMTDMMNLLQSMASGGAIEGGTGGLSDQAKADIREIVDSESISKDEIS